MDEDMEEQDRHVMRRHNSSDELDRALDAALAKYAAVEPRSGLEERVLANLRAEQARRLNHAWRRWAFGATAVAVVVLTIALAWRSARPSQPAAANRRPVVKQDLPKPGTEMASHDGKAVRSRPPHPGHSANSPSGYSAALGAASPKLDRFPSPQPPSAEELALRRYVRAFPQEAILIARAQEEYLKEIQQEMKDGRSATELSDSDREER